MQLQLSLSQFAAALATAAAVVEASAAEQLQPQHGAPSSPATATVSWGVEGIKVSLRLRLELCSQPACAALALTRTTASPSFLAPAAAHKHSPRRLTEALFSPLALDRRGRASKLGPQHEGGRRYERDRKRVR